VFMGMAIVWASWISTRPPVEHMDKGSNRLVEALDPLSLRTCPLRQLALSGVFSLQG